MPPRAYGEARLSLQPPRSNHRVPTTPFQPPVPATVPPMRINVPFLSLSPSNQRSGVGLRIFVDATPATIEYSRPPCRVFVHTLSIHKVVRIPETPGDAGAREKTLGIDRRTCRLALSDPGTPGLASRRRGVMLRNPSRREATGLSPRTLVRATLQPAWTVSLPTALS